MALVDILVPVPSNILFLRSKPLAPCVILVYKIVPRGNIEEKALSYDTLPTIQPKIPLALAATDLAVIMRSIDNAESIDDALTQMFGTALANMADAVDRRILFRQTLDYTIKMAQETAKAWREKVKALENAMERFEANTLAIMQDEDSVKYKGKMGELAAQRSPAKLELAFETKTASISNAVLTDTLHFYEVPAEFRMETTVTQLRKEKVKEALLAGAKFEWASITHGRHLRVKI